ncbi:uncharacterized protein LOC117650746 [Thrips palmi]|uniref:Uncharacterized protein LOC117650746 n=1 Tax=Thrips palmi TaxID=161013 RepID=A0A6P8ZYN0_THRPL|nr:uncharacterized protein LOC117650746 [Thrips palmi]
MKRKRAQVPVQGECGPGPGPGLGLGPINVEIPAAQPDLPPVPALVVPLAAVAQPPLVSPTPSTSSSEASASTPRDLIKETEEKLASGEWKTRPKELANGKPTKSPAWDGFHVVVWRDNTKIEAGTAVCLACGAVLISSGGPSSLKKHVEKYCSGQLHSASSAPGQGFRPVSAQLRDVFIDKVADTCAESMGAVHLITSEAVVDLMQTVADIAARCKGRIDVRNIMPQANTVMNRIDSRAKKFVQELVPRVKKAIEDMRCQAATDMWTDDNEKKHFIAITVAFVDETGKASETHDLVVAQFPSAMKATGSNILKAMYDAMEEIGITREEFRRIDWITDRGANIKKALEDLSKEDCAAHQINTCVRSTFTVPFYELRQKAMEALSPAGKKLLQDSENVVRAVKAAKPDLIVPGVALRELKKALPLPQQQFSSNNCKMLQSLQSHKKKVLAVLAALGRQDLIEVLNEGDASDLIGFLGPLEKKGSVAAGELASLRAHLAAKPEDTEEVAAMKSSVAELRDLMEVLILIKEAKELVTYLKASGLASSLSRKVIQECETRWNSMHSMLASVDLMYDEIVELLSLQEGQETRMEKIDREMLQWLISFLQEFKEETKTLEGDNRNHPTLPYVLLVSTGLRDHCLPSPDDSHHLAVIKERCLVFLGAKFQPSMKAKVANFLWPDFKELSMLPEEEKEEVKAHVRSLIDGDADGGTGAVNPDDTDTPPSPPKARRLDTKYNRYRQAAIPNTPQDEVSRYLATNVAPVPAELLLEHWRLLDRPDGFPKLAKLALRELGKLATAATSERVWSKAGFILNSRRNRLSAGHLSSMVFLASYLRFLRRKNK